MTEIEARGKIKYRIANEMQKAGENKEEYEDLEIALQVMKEIREYREIGTVEELQALKEKNEPKKPKMIGYRRDGEPVYECGCCGSTLKFADQPFCMICSCKLNWE